MYSDLNAYKPSATQLKELDFCPISLFYYMTTETMGDEIARGSNFAQIEAEFYKRLEVEDILKRPYDHTRTLDKQDITRKFYETVEWDLKDTQLSRLFWQFCRYQASRLSGMKRDEEYLLKFFFPYLCEFELEGMELVGRPDTVFRLPPHDDVYYIQDTKTSMSTPGWVDGTVAPFTIKKTPSYYTIVRQITVYYIILKEQKLNIDHGHILHISPNMFISAPFHFATLTANTILKKKIPSIRSVLNTFRETVTEADNRKQIKELGDKLIKRHDPWKCNACSRSYYCACVTTR